MIRGLSACGVNIEEALEIARLVLALGEVDRGTRHPDGERPETDTTHTVMLALVAARVAAAEGLDVGRAVLFALVHDLPEAWAGDVNTARELTAEQRQAKDAAEAAAVRRIAEDVPGLVRLIDEYEQMDTPEAELVHVLDKIMPKLTHALNGGAVLGDLQMTLGEVRTSHATQRARLRAQHPRVHTARAHALFDEACRHAEACIATAHGEGRRVRLKLHPSAPWSWARVEAWGRKQVRVRLGGRTMRLARAATWPRWWPGDAERLDKGGA